MKRMQPPPIVISQQQLMQSMVDFWLKERRNMFIYGTRQKPNPYGTSRVQQKKKRYFDGQIAWFK